RSGDHWREEPDDLGEERCDQHTDDCRHDHRAEDGGDVPAAGEDGEDRGHVGERDSLHQWQLRTEERQPDGLQDGRQTTHEQAGSDQQADTGGVQPSGVSDDQRDGDDAAVHGQDVLETVRQVGADTQPLVLRTFPFAYCSRRSHCFSPSRPKRSALRCGGTQAATPMPKDGPTEQTTTAPSTAPCPGGQLDVPARNRPPADRLSAGGRTLLRHAHSLTRSITLSMSSLHVTSPASAASVTAIACCLVTTGTSSPSALKSLPFLTTSPSRRRKNCLSVMTLALPPAAKTEGSSVLPRLRWLNSRFNTTAKIAAAEMPEP